MTARPHPTLFDNVNADQTHAVLLLRPNVTEHFWGYEVRPNEHVIGVADLLRGLCGFLTVTSIVAALGIWIVPAMSFVSQAIIAKTCATVLLLALVFVLGRTAARGSQVRVQIDTAAGEIREVINGATGRTVVLARYSFDKVDKIDVVAAYPREMLGQLQVTLKGHGKFAHRIPIGDGGVILLGPLRSRLAADCGLDGLGPKRAPGLGVSAVA